ncbi:MAG: TonB-dependent siderophore receptor [Achromobacter sp.]|uniref:TonB-dependent siderophore receptor n=1 Tax=Achromobacter sp. TaxID=134375 RepID=UPI003D0800E5
MHDRLSRRAARLIGRAAPLLSPGRLAVLSLSATLLSPAALAQPAARAYAIPAGSLESVLTRYALESRLMLSYAAADVAGKRSGGLSGSHDPASALSQILAGTGMRASLQPNGGYLLHPAPGADGAQTLPSVTVTGERPETAWGPARGFVAKRSATATKTDTPLHETPQSVSVVPRAQVVAQAADSLDQALAYTAGVMSLDGGAVRNISTGFTVRGFNITGSAPLYLNGTRFPINSLSGAMEPYNYERIEVLKGPASILYGQAAPGGIINLVSKRPTAEPLREMEVKYGTWNTRQLAMDFGGPLTEDGNVRYRLSGLGRDADTMVRYINNDRLSLSGALEWQISGATQLTLLGGWSRTDNPYDVGKPREGTLLPNPNGRISRSVFLGEPGFDRFVVQGGHLGYLLEHKLNDDWQVRQNLLGYNHRANNRYASVISINAANPALADRLAVSRDDTDKGIAVDNQLLGKLRHGRFEHTLLFGVDASRSSLTRDQALTFDVAPINLYDPVYGNKPTLGPARRGISRSRQLGFYAQDQIKFDGRWIALFGGRYDRARTEDQPGDGPQDSHAISPRAGLMYLFDNGLAPYYSFTKSFQPTEGMDFNGRPFKPTTGTQHEIGLKYEPPGANASITLALYDITQRNVVTADSAHPGFSVQTGEVRSRGAELEGRASLGHDLDVVAAFTLTNARITKSNRDDVGARPVSVPRTMASLWLDYKVPALPGLSTAAGIRYVGHQEIEGVPVPTYTVLDAALRYRLRNWEFALNVKNLANKRYIAACPGNCYYGDERNVMLTARVNW